MPYASSYDDSAVRPRRVKPSVEELLAQQQVPPTSTTQPADGLKIGGIAVAPNGYDSDGKWFDDFARRFDADFYKDRSKMPRQNTIGNLLQNTPAPPPPVLNDLVQRGPVAPIPPLPNDRPDLTRRFELLNNQDKGTRDRRVDTSNPGLSKLGQLLERVRSEQANAPTDTTIPDDALNATPAMRSEQPIPYPGVQSEQEMAHTSRGYKTLGRTPGTKPMDRLGLLEEAPLGSKVERGASGNYEVSAPKKPSRFKKALEGFLSMGAMAGASGPTEGSAMRFLGGGGAGAVAGAVKPRLIEKFQRENELEQLRGDIGADQSIDLRNAQIAETAAQAAQRTADAEMVDYTDPASGEIYKIPRKDVSRVKQQYQLNQDRKADNERADKALKETARYHDAMLNKTEATEEITVAGRKLKVSPSTAARILEERTKAGGKLEPSREAAIEAELEDEAGNDHLAKRKAADEQASELRAERDKLTHKSVKQPDGTWGWREDEHQTKQNAKRIADLDRQIAEAEKESAYRQKEADDAFSRRNKAKAKAGSASGSSAKSGRTIEGAIAAFEKARKRKPTAAETENMRAALNR